MNYLELGRLILHPYAKRFVRERISLMTSLENSMELHVGSGYMMCCEEKETGRYHREALYKMNRFSVAGNGEGEVTGDLRVGSGVTRFSVKSVR